MWVSDLWVDYTGYTHVLIAGPGAPTQRINIVRISPTGRSHDILPTTSDALRAAFDREGNIFTFEDAKGRDVHEPDLVLVNWERDAEIGWHTRLARYSDASVTEFTGLVSGREKSMTVSAVGDDVAKETIDLGPALGNPAPQAATADFTARAFKSLNRRVGVGLRDRALLPELIGENVMAALALLIGRVEVGK